MAFLWCVLPVLNTVHTSNNVEATFDFVAETVTVSNEFRVDISSFGVGRAYSSQRLKYGRVLGERRPQEASVLWPQTFECNAHLVHNVAMRKDTVNCYTNFTTSVFYCREHRYATTCHLA